ncbi:transporter substrate-binding domain-containing protein [bacterium M00.F.Ca.ET.194.01.1.1]|nr:transporter substrate-binding domain-containing protein [bacterium M00.F.Ca.ET.194.01.1.1]TGS52330.1 transporter substrate-binding domain-containing protein [bacterium M00.F.Ca.ET.179.01.1.1]TGV44191.1 transporter substrate-binding domain-containing protein [bacterium M00.F.Ca.ET.168.01.1.1]
MTKNKTIFLGIAATLIALHSVSAAAQEVKIATDGGYPPFNSQDSSGNVIGFEADLYKDLCKRIEKTCTMSVTDWDGIIPSLNQGRFDAIMAGMSITEDRKKVVAFSKPYADLPTVIIVNRDNELSKLNIGISDITFGEMSAEEDTALKKLQEALKGKTIAVQTSTVHQKFSESVFKDSTVQTYDTMENAGLDLASGRVDAFITDLSFLKDFAKNEQGKALVQIGPNLFGGALGEGRAMALNKNNPQLVEQFDKAIDASIADGTVTKLSQQWFGFDVTPKH